MLSNDRTLAPEPEPPGRPGDRAGTRREGGGRLAGIAGLARDWRLLAGVVLATAGVAVQLHPALDLRLFRGVNGLGPAEPALWSDLSVAGLGLSAWIYLLFDAQDRPARVARLLWILVVGGLVIHAIKQALPLPRPLAALGPGGLAVIGAELRTHSMPSGHSAMAFAMLGLMAGELARDARARHGAAAPAWFAGLGWCVLAVGIALARMAVGAHWPADVGVGAGLGLAFAALAERAWPVAALTRIVERPWGARLMAIGLLVSAAAISATPGALVLAGVAGAPFAHQLETGYPLAEPLQWLLGVVALVGAARWWMAAGRRPAPAG
jgi:undecaprenyl-diphosphatase